MTIKILIIYGTRPEAIKLAPLIQAAEKHDLFEAVACSTGQHREMLDQVNDYFEITPRYQLRLMQPGQSLSGLTARCLESLKGIVDEALPDIVVAQGDTTTAMCAGLTAFYHRLPFCHVEAGLRTDDIASPFPEELNRRICSLAADLHCAPTAVAADNLLREGYEPDRVHVTGNTVIDALQWAVARERKQPGRWVQKYAVFGERKVVLVTAHRRENHGAGIRELCKAVLTLANQHSDVHFVYPVHLNPGIRGPVFEMLSGLQNVLLTEPASYPEFVWLMDRCDLILSDSGGVQEEAPSLGKPVLVTRDCTERPEALEAGATRLVGTSPESVVPAVTELLRDERVYQRMVVATNPYGDGNASHRILDLIAQKHGEPGVSGRAVC